MLLKKVVDLNFLIIDLYQPDLEWPVFNVECNHSKNNRRSIASADPKIGNLYIFYFLFLAENVKGKLHIAFTKYTES
jgi:hypothetical protein